MKLIPALVLVFAVACGDGKTPEPPPEEKTPPTVEPEAPAGYPPGRRIRRLTADQLYNSLEVATGVKWSGYAEFAKALGRADYGEITDESTDPSVTFDKLATDAAMSTCAGAILDDLYNEADTIMRHARGATRDEALYRTNLQYLFLRFLGVHIDDPQDERLQPWVDLLKGNEPPPDEFAMAMRWFTTCVGLATHPDFLTY